MCQIFSQRRLGQNNLHSLVCQQCLFQSLLLPAATTIQLVPLAFATPHQQKWIYAEALTSLCGQLWMRGTFSALVRVYRVNLFKAYIESIESKK